MTKEVAIIPGKKKGLHVRVSFNGKCRATMIVDTGATGCCLSEDIIKHLFVKDIITIDDMIGTATSTLADGTTTHGCPVWKINDLKIGDIEIGGVKMIMMPSGSAPILGLDVFDRFCSWTIDNVNKKIIFGEKK